MVVDLVAHGCEFVSSFYMIKWLLSLFSKLINSQSMKTQNRSFAEMDDGVIQASGLNL